MHARRNAGEMGLKIVYRITPQPEDHQPVPTLKFESWSMNAAAVIPNLGDAVCFDPENEHPIYTVHHRSYFYGKDELTVYIVLKPEGWPR